MVLQMKNPHKNLNELIYLINLANACRCPENMLLIPGILFTTKQIVLNGPFYSKVNTNYMWAMMPLCNHCMWVIPIAITLYIHFMYK